MRVKPLIAIPLIAIALAGCSAQTHTPQETTAATEQKPLFATDAEALAAAEAAYANYLEVSDQIARDGGANPERLKGFVSQDQYLTEIEPFTAMKTEGSAQTGQSSFDTLHLQTFTGEEVTAYLCLDNSKVSITTAYGETKTPSTPRWPLLVSFKLDSNNKLVLSGSETWSGTNFC
ncbi:hypothetical protein [Aurantimicrobium minutum]|uniref:hypothetical protein n=1 Tax=Aurantimicrobium minutum TaxID=708131 RepID=UPI002476DF0E|nr:hypothetical protein [Aurantimicrobium minutum]MDH6208094.1 hypothetical protein [Aurantimicrobium minutum]